MLSNDDIRTVNIWREIADSWIARGNYINRVCQNAIDNGTMKGMDEMPEYAFNAGNFNANFGGGGQSLPVGMHPVVIKKTELKPTNNNDGGKMVVTMLAIDGPAKDGTQIMNLNLQNKSAEAVRIANEQLAAICAVIGKPGLQMRATEELHDIPFVIEVAPQKDKPQYVEVVGVFTMDGKTPADVLQGGASGGGNANAFGGGNNGNNGGGNFGGGNGGGNQGGGNGFGGGGAGAGAGAGGGGAWGGGAGAGGGAGGGGGGQSWGAGAGGGAGGGGKPAWGG